MLFGLYMNSHAQISYTGHYGYHESRKDLLSRFPGTMIGKDESGFQDDLVIVKLDGNRYKFWLYIVKGYPGYNSGHTEGIILIVKDTAVFIEPDTILSTTCKLIFRFSKNNVEVIQGFSNCGFGANVYAEGDYPRKSLKATITDIMNTYQYDISTSTVITAKSFIYDEASAIKVSKKYFIKGDKVYASEEEGDFMFARFMSKTGKYTEGWIKKSTIR
jgi:hypothetical protein